MPENIDRSESDSDFGSLRKVKSLERKARKVSSQVQGENSISDHDSMSDDKSTIRNEVSSFAAFNSGKPQAVNTNVYFGTKNKNYTEGIKAKRRLLLDRKRNSLNTPMSAFSSTTTIPTGINKVFE